MDRIKSYHLVYKDRKWQLKAAGNPEAIEFFRTKKIAMDFCKPYLRRVTGSLKIHKRNGQIQEERTYPRRRDPHSSAG